MKTSFISTALLIALLSPSAFATTEELAFEGACSIFDGQTRTEVGSFSLDHDAAMRHECPHATIDFVLPFSSIKHTVYIEHQGVGSKVYSGIYLNYGGKQLAHATTDETPVSSRLTMGAALNGAYSIHCEGVLK